MSTSQGQVKKQPPLRAIVFCLLAFALVIGAGIYLFIFPSWECPYCIGTGSSMVVPVDEPDAEPEECQGCAGHGTVTYSRKRHLEWLVGVR